jgi:hypothetical protein
MKNRFLEVLDSMLGGRLSSAFREAATATDDDPRATEYRRLSGSTRDLAPLSFERLQQMNFYLWQRNPMARRMLKILVDFCIGDDFAVKVKVKQRVKDGPDKDTGRPDVQKIWDDFAKDPVNNLEDDLPLFAQDLFMNGELILNTIANVTENTDGTVTGDGTVRLGYIDPMNVKESVPDPMNVRQIVTIKVRPKDSADLIPLQVIRIDTNAKSPTFNRYIGDVFYFRINRTVNQTRGTGELSESADWLDAMDQFLFDALDGFKQRNAFFYDLTLDGYNEQQIIDHMKKVSVPRNGTIRAHNEKAHYDAVTPDLKSQDVGTALTTVQTFIVGNKGYPIMWFGSGAETNKATAGEMAIPTLRMLKAAQKILRGVVKQLALYVCQQASVANILKLDENEYVDVEVTMFDFERKDATDLGQGFTQLVQGLTVAVEKGWASDETAKKIVDGFVTRMGVEVDPDETVEDNQATQDEKKANDDANNIYPPRVKAPGYNGNDTGNQPVAPGKMNGNGKGVARAAQ